jgi:hypothetical protein
LRKREEKEEVKRITKAAKEQRRANRDENMEFFAVYYKDKCNKMKFIEFKKDKKHPERILNMLEDASYLRKMQKYVLNQRNRPWEK